MNNNKMGNRIEFLVDDNDVVIKCTYYEYIDEKIVERIILPEKELYKVFTNCFNKYGEPTLKSLSERMLISFNDVDVNEMDILIERSRKYQESLNQDMSPINIPIPQKDNTVSFVTNNNQKQKDNKPKKVVRKNKFKNTVIKTSAAILTLLAIYGSIKVLPTTLNNININNTVSPISYETSFLDFKNHQNIFPSPNVIDNENTVIENEITEEETIAQEKNAIDNNLIETENNTTTSEETENIEETENELIPDYVFSLNAEDWTNEEKYYITNAWYSEAITEYAKMYGIDPKLAIAIATHERGKHSEYVDEGGGIGLFQIQVEGGWNWNGKEITAYNFNTNSYETVTITKESVSDVFENIKVGCMMLQEIIIRNNYNILTSVTEYNYGAPYVQSVIDRCSSETGFSVKELNCIDNTEWLKYRNIINGGDPNYLENVFKYIPDDTILTFTKPDGNTINIQYNNTRNLEHSV